MGEGQSQRERRSSARVLVFVGYPAFMGLMGVMRELILEDSTLSEALVVGALAAAITALIITVVSLYRNRSSA